MARTEEQILKFDCDCHGFIPSSWLKFLSYNQEAKTVLT